MTASAFPYIGELSINNPPLSNNVRSTFLSGSRSEADVPTSKVCQVPHPTTGSSSPVDGTGRFSMAWVTFDPSSCCMG